MVKRNAAYSLAGQLLTLAAAFICIPIVFRQLGTERFGLLTLIWSLLSYSIVFDLGTGPAVARATAASLVRDDGRRLRAIMRAGMLIQVALGVAFGIVLWMVASWLLGILKVPPHMHADATRAVSALAVALPFVLLMQSQQGVLEGLERFGSIALIRTPVAIATYLIPAIGATLGWSLAQIMVWVAASRIVGALAMFGISNSALPAQQHGTFRDELPGLFRYGRWLAVSGVLTQLLTYIDRFLLSSMHGLNAVAQYTAPYDAASKLLVLPGSIGVAMFPRLAKDAVRDQTGDARARSKGAAKATLLILLPIVTVLIAFARPLLEWWLGPQISSAGVGAFRLLLVATFFHAAAFAPVILIEALGRSDVVARYYSTELFVYLPVVAFTIWRFGVIGAAAAWVARTFALMLWSHWYAHRR